MKSVACFLLRAKHWQIFLLVFGVYCAGQIVAMNSMLAAGSTTAGVGIPFGILMTLFGLLFLGWFWSMGSFLGSIVRGSLRPKFRFFRFALIYPFFYGIVFFKFVLLLSQPVQIFLIVPFHLLAMFCVFYIMYFDSKSLVLAETDKPASFYDYAKPFFLLCFFPIGVWIIQPRINRLYAERRRGADQPIHSVGWEDSWEPTHSPS
jgi:hypothetical protein